MDDSGLLTSFLVCKIGVALAALAFLGIILSMQASVGRLAEREDLTQVADAIAGAIKAIDSLPDEAEIQRNLPAISQQFEVVMTVSEAAGCRCSACTLLRMAKLSGCSHSRTK